MTEEKKTTEAVRTEREMFRISQKAIMYNRSNQTFLILKAAETKDGAPSHAVWREVYGPWDLPGGHVDKGETDLKEALDRELVEEIGVSPADEGYLIHQDLQTKSGAKVVGAFSIHLFFYSGDVTLSDEHVEYKWMTAEEVESDDEVKQWIVDAVHAAQKKIAEIDAHDNMLRILAEFDNYKKRSEEQRKEFAQYASEKVVMDMLPVLDNFHAATAHVPEDQADSPWLTGIMYIQKQMEKVFEDAGVTEIAIASGDVFDPETMEAMKSNDASDESDAEASDKEQKVERVVQKGYKIKEKVMRPARVTVA